MPATLIKAKEVVSGGVLKPAPITNQFDPALVAPHIQVAEANYIINVVGKDMYLDMISKQNSSPANYNPDLGAIVQKFPTEANYETLWTEYLAQLTANAVILTAMPFVGVQISTSGIFMNQVEWAENAGVKGVQFMADNLQDIVETQQRLVQEFLCENGGTYPLFPKLKLCECDEQPIQKGFTGGFLLSGDYQQQPYKKRTDYFL